MAGAQSPAGFDFYGMQVATVCTGVVKLAGNLAAVGWFGMWMGMTTRKTSLAIFKTVCFVVVLPAIALSFGQGMMMGMFMLAKWPFWMSIALSGVLSLAKNIGFIILARQFLYTGFRDAMLRESRVAASNLPPVPPRAPPPIAPPPRITAGVGTA